MKDWIRLHSGGKFHLLNPRVSEINIDDICWASSQLCRFTGQCEPFYSVGEHACHVSDALPLELKLVGLLHDAAESLLGDVNSPLKHLLPQYVAIERRVERVIARKFGLPFPFPPAVKEADLRALAVEQKYIMPGKDHEQSLYAPLDIKIRPWSMARTRREFMKRFQRLYSA